MSNHLFNPNPINFQAEPLFLGTGRNITRLDLSIEPHISKMTESALGKLWFSGDFSVSKDGKDYINNEPKLNLLFMKNLTIYKSYSFVFAYMCSTYIAFLH